MTYAPFLAAALALWPVVAFLGGQAYSPILALAALPALAWLRPAQLASVPALVALLFLAWAGISSAWSPAGGALVSGSLAAGDFSVNAAAVRVVTTGLAALLVFAAAARVPAGRARLSAWTALAAFAVNGIAVAALFLFYEDITGFFYGDDAVAALQQGLQNVLRNANAFALVLPVLSAWLWHRKPALPARALALAMTLAALPVFAALGGAGSQAAVIAVIASLLAMALVRALPRSGYRVLFAFGALYLVLAPGAVLAAATLVERLGLTLPFSFQSRLFAWQAVSERIAEQPLIGHGMEAAGSWREPFSARPDWLETIIAAGGDPAAWSVYPIIAGHPHNMALELWAETGLVGVALAAIALVATGVRLPAPADLPASVRHGAAGLFGATASLFSFTYSVWNEAFWASVAFAAGALILIARQEAARA